MATDEQTAWGARTAEAYVIDHIQTEYFLLDLKLIN